ncbi:glucosaminidase domain-containing protein [Pediococcus pentosaceus]|uniref:N-acetylmuramidase n=1 Tax=Pediococcus pentosaceus TaxID=1255 RepID=A0ABQ6XGT1_PEDPE|nr:glucosaminidase domain-containing protein [Pediococcus pentosaceus]KAF0413556.1 N-acetylmuramidase [Pediococcus pentosaceus]KAF0503871.1 N-acetylmuramidase [Pediococcus pentosaceus]MBU7003598.1 KxYKxGKxW signal peptide domain-containing protein [Pediococcus pentosaceus]MCG9225797.1 glucosaminidase domain-containing protein [Pediococcus pentosaceus]MDA8035802.1 glucosaminidase domain-containing protein [Pediococcus pentosaceus]
MNSKLHYKMFKAGKKWAFASIAAASLGIIALDANATNVHADSTDNDATDTVDDSTTTSPVSEASVTLTKTSLPASASVASSAVTSTATSSAVSKSATNSVVTSSSAKSAISSSATSTASSSAKKSVASSAASSASEKTVSSTAKSVANSSSVVKNTSSSSTKNSSAAVSVVAHSNSSAASSTASSKAAIKTSSAASVSSSAVSKTSSAATTSKNKAVDKKSTSKDYTIDYTHQLSDDEGSDQQTKNNVIIAHATGVYAPAENVAIFEKREWDSSESYVQYIVGDGGKVYAVGQEGYVAWGAGEWANENAPVQVELAQTYSDSQFKKDYQTYVNLLRDSAKKWNIPTSLDSSEYRGIKSHVWITNHVWGNHVDPYGYLSTHGISQTQFAHDLQYGFGSSSSDSSNNTSNDSNKNNANNSNKNDSNSNKNNSSKINVGDKVTIKTSAKHWATGQTIYSAVKGKTYKVIQVNGSRLLLEKVLSWINTSDVTTASSSNHSNSNKNNGNKNNSNKNDSNKNNSTANIKVGSKVTIKSSAKHWATGQTIYNAVKGKTYKVIQVNGNRLLLDKVISWINKGDVTVPGSSSANHSSSSNSSKNNSNKNNSNKNTNTNSIKVGSKVTIKTSAKHWATGQSIYSAVKGKTYKVMQINGNKLLLDKVISWINKGDVTVPGSSSSNQSSSNKGNSSNSNKNNSSNKIGVGSKVIQVNGSKLLLDKVISWINRADVTLAGSKSNSGSSNKNNAASMHNVNVHLTNKHWTTAQTNFVNGIAADIVNVCNSNKLYASVAMAQAVLESGYGTSSLAQEAHNLFGIKADSTWKGATYTKSTKEVINGRTVTINASFRKYASIKDSIADYAKKLESRAQYANAFAPKSANYVASIKAIKAGGYATSTTYVGSIINCINSNGFFKLDGLSKALHL